MRFIFGYGHVSAHMKGLHLSAFFSSLAGRTWSLGIHSPILVKLHCEFGCTEPLL